MWQNGLASSMVASGSEQVSHPAEAPRPAISWLHRIQLWILNHIWYVHPGAVVSVALRPGVCMKYLNDASRPRVNRLDFGNLFVHGQRYKLHILDELHFMMTVTHSIPWRYRGRTTSSAVLFGNFVKADAHSVHLHLKGRIRLFYILQFVLMPGFIASIVIYMPWPRPVIACLIMLLFALSWFGHRYHAALEAHDMVFFIQKVMDEHHPEPAPMMAEGAHITYEEADFSEAWERFYQSVKHAGDET